MSDIDWYKHPLYIPDKKTVLSEGEATYSLREAWKELFGNYPTDKTLAILFAHAALETGRFKLIHCYNYGNIKRNPNDGFYFTMYPAGEYEKGKYVPYNPPNLKCHFRAYKSAVDGAKEFISFLSKPRYVKARAQLISGNPEMYSHELSVAQYYTALESDYTPTVIKIFNEFLRRKDELLAWKPVNEGATVESPAVSVPIPSGPVVDPIVDKIESEELDTLVDNKVPEEPEEKAPDTERDPNIHKEITNTQQPFSFVILGVIVGTVLSIQTCTSDCVHSCSSKPIPSSSVK
jgi:hypothetical protein